MTDAPAPDSKTRSYLLRLGSALSLALIASGLWLCGQGSPELPDASVPECPPTVAPDLAPDAGVSVADGGTLDLADLASL